MGKTKGPIKAKSRADRRAVTPPMEIDGVERPASPGPQQKVAILGLRGDDGVQKKKSVRGKQLSTKQKLRKEKMLERGEAVTEKLVNKIDYSKSKARKVQGRRVRISARQFQITSLTDPLSRETGRNRTKRCRRLSTMRSSWLLLWTRSLRNKPTKQ